MRRASLIWAVVITVALLVLASFLRRPAATGMPRDRSGAVSPDPTAPDVSPSVGSSSSSPQLRSATTAQPTDLRRREELNKLETTPISFYGQVVDENNQPVGGAETTYTVHH